MCAPRRKVFLASFQFTRFSPRVCAAAELSPHNDKSQIFEEVDVSQDNQIQFKEFWSWWKRGRPNKLEAIVYLKIKALKYLRRVHGDFIRYGPSLEAKYEPNISRHYFALNYGQSQGKLGFKLRLLMNNPE